MAISCQIPSEQEAIWRGSSYPQVKRSAHLRTSTKPTSRVIRPSSWQRNGAILVSCVAYWIMGLMIPCPTRRARCQNERTRERTSTYPDVPWMKYLLHLAWIYGECRQIFHACDTTQWWNIMKFGRWYSFLIQGFLGSMVIFQGV